MSHELAAMATSSPRVHVYDVQGGTHHALYRVDMNYWHNVVTFLNAGGP